MSRDPSHRQQTLAQGHTPQPTGSWELRLYYTIRCFTCVFDFSRVFPRVLDTNMLVCKTRVKM